MDNNNRLYSDVKKFSEIDLQSCAVLNLASMQM